MEPAYTTEETQYYRWLFALCDLDHDGTIGDTDRQWLQPQSGLPLDVVDQVVREQSAPI